MTPDELYALICSGFRIENFSVRIRSQINLWISNPILREITCKILHPGRNNMQDARVNDLQLRLLKKSVICLCLPEVLQDFHI